VAAAVLPAGSAMLLSAAAACAAKAAVARGPALAARLLARLAARLPRGDAASELSSDSAATDGRRSKMSNCRTYAQGLQSTSHADWTEFGDVGIQWVW